MARVADESTERAPASIGVSQILFDLDELSQRRPRWAAGRGRYIGVHIGFDEALSHLIEAGSDAFLMPSRFEPCGLNQMYSLRYGTVPVVRAVGGLADTVTEDVGFVFEDYTPAALLETVRRATHVYAEDPVRWLAMMKRGMARDYSWDHAASEYAAVYQRSVSLRSSQA